MIYCHCLKIDHMPNQPPATAEFFLASGICCELRGAGHSAYVVGGWVRDLLGGKRPHDCDVCTSATAEEVLALYGEGGPLCKKGCFYQKAVSVGAKHGTVAIARRDPLRDYAVSVEVTTFKGVADSTPAHVVGGPDGLSVPKGLEDDLNKRDFTINAIAFDVSDGNRGGYFLAPSPQCFDDVDARIIRCMGDPNERFAEDPLRILRGIRFLATLDGFTLDDATARAMTANAHRLRGVSGERIRDELSKILMSDRPATLLLAAELGITKFVLPEFDATIGCPQNGKWHRMDVADHILATVAGVPKDDFVLRWAALLHDVGKPLCLSTDANGHNHFYGHPEQSAKLAEGICARLRFDGKSTEAIVRLCATHDRLGFSKDAGDKAYRRAIKDVGPDLFDDWVRLVQADMMAHSPRAMADGLRILGKVKEVHAKSITDKTPFSVAGLAIDGDGVCETLGIGPGPTIGKALRFLLDAVLDDPSLNEREKLEALLRNAFGKECMK